MIRRVEMLVEQPYRSLFRLFSYFNRPSLYQENLALKKNLLENSERELKARYLEYENFKLKELVEFRGSLDKKTVVARLKEYWGKNHRGEITIDRGKDCQLKIGQAVLTKDGLFGQLIAVAEKTSLVLPVYSRDSAIPVLNLRNGLQSIVIGTGAGNNLSIVNIQETADYLKGDQLVTSGLGGAIGAGYLVGTVHEIRKIAHEAFMEVTVTPNIIFSKDLYVLVVLDDES